MPLKVKIIRYFSLDVWGGLPGSFQRWLSGIYTRIYNTKVSRRIIGIYCKWNYSDPNYLEKFKPASGESTYQSFQDFFTRVFREPLKITHKYIWACEGLLCEYGKVSEMQIVKVKGQKRQLKNIFGNAEVPDESFFSNVFLHNNNYHRIHSPAEGRISRIEHIPGDLVILRPWIYENDPSIPALRNERINVDIETSAGKWFLSIVGGPAVGTIVLNAQIAVGNSIGIGSEIAKFILGSTCCIVSPVPLRHAKVGDQVEVAQPL